MGLVRQDNWVPLLLYTYIRGGERAQIQIYSIPNPVPTNFQSPGNKTPHAQIIAITQSNIRTSKIVLYYVITYDRGRSFFTQKTEGSFEMQRVCTLYIELRRSSKAYINCSRPPRRRCIIRKTRVSRSEKPNQTLIYIQPQPCCATTRPVYVSSPFLT